MSRLKLIERHRLLWCMALALVFIASPAVAETRPATPAIHFAAPVFDFGKAMAGDVVRHDFSFTNTGSATLQIQAVTPSCGCTTVSDWTRKLDPGQVGSVVLQFDTTRFHGPVSERATIVCNDPVNHNVVLAFKGTVVKSLDINPPMIVLKPMFDSPEGATNSAKIISHLPDPITLGKPVSDNPALFAELKRIVPEKEFQLVVRTGPAARATMTQGNISMRTSSAKFPSVIVPVLVMPQAPLTLTPGMIDLPRGPLSAVSNITVSLRYNGRTPLVVTAATIDMPIATLQVKQIRAGREFAFEMTFPAGFELPLNREASLSIQTASADAPVIKVPFRAIQPPAPVPPGFSNH
jgi:hypothetical protein